MTTPTTFLNVQVTVTQKIDSEGKTSYDTTFDPPSLTVKARDSVINYQIVESTPAGIIFSDVSIKPDHENQLSTPSISRSGRLVTFSDENSVKMTLNLTFRFKDPNGVEFLVDPELDNEPPPVLDSK
jgi:hypothetical protein